MLSLKDLNPQQREAVTTTSGPVLLLAGAGSGKTRVIIYRIAYLIERMKVAPKHILAVTFTNKAANEMQERLREMLESTVKGLQVSTFHSLCVKILRKHIHHLEYRSNFTIYDASDQLSVIKGIIDDNGYQDTGLIDAKSAHFAIGQAKTWGKTPEDFLIQKHSMRDVLIGRVFREYQETLKGCNAIDFDDILNLTLELMKNYSEVRHELSELYRYIMVDEYQDTNRAQYELLRYLTQTHRNLCVVGDDDQSIYGWRGADIRNILDFEKDYAEAQIIKLEQNYRSTQTILTAANHVIENNDNRMVKTLWSDKRGGEQLGWIVGADEMEEMGKVTDQIRLQVMRSALQYRDHAILFRSNFQSRVIEEALRDGSVPYVVVGSTSFYDRKEVKDAIAYLRVVFNTRDEVNLHRIINYPKRGIGKTSLIHANMYCNQFHKPLFSILEKASEYSKISSEAARSMEYFAHTIRRYKLRFQNERMDQVFVDLLDEVGFIRELEKEKTDAKTKERRITCVLELLRSVQQYVSKNPDKTLKDYLERIMLFSKEDPKDEEANNAVTLLTLHSAKGLEFPYVFMVGMAEGVFPNKRALDEGGESEERRLCYVGITRAQKGLTFSMAKSRKRYSETLPQEPSRFLTEIDQNLFSKPVEGQLSERQKQANAQQARSQFFAQIKQMRGE